MTQVSYLWRLLATGFAFVLFGIAGLLIPLLSVPLLRLLYADKASREVATRRLVHLLFKVFIHLMRLLGILSWRTEGMEKLNRPGLLVLANHPTLIDVVFIIAFIPNANCIVKSRLLNNPVMRSFILSAGYIANDQGVGLIETAAASLKSGSNLVVFPEGTRTRSGETMKLQRGAANIAVRCKTDITPVVIDCSPPTLGKHQRWYDIPPTPVVLSFWVKDDISIDAFLNAPATLGARRLTESLEQFFTRESRNHGHQGS